MISFIALTAIVFAWLVSRTDSTAITVRPETPTIRSLPHDIDVPAAKRRSSITNR